MEDFPVFMKAAPPVWEALPLGKIVSFPNGSDIYSHIYAQMQIYWQDGLGLHLRMLSFETVEDETRNLSFTLFTEDGRLELAFSQTGLINPPPSSKIVFSPFTGEDLQGVFWGGTVLIPEAELEAQLGNLGGILKTGHILGQATNNAALSAGLFKPPHGKFVFSKYETKERI